MRLFSNPQSVDKGEISALAIIETVLAMGITVSIGLVRDDWGHVIVAVCIAPFLLLRTDFATLTGVRWADRGEGWLRDFVRAMRKRHFITAAIGDALGVAGLIILPFVIRVLTVVLGVLRDPVGSIKAIPLNWKRFALVIDFAHPPEVVPGHWKHGAKDSAYEWPFVRAFFAITIRRHRGFWRILGLLVDVLTFPVLLVSIFLPAILYRMSLKSTSVIYLPFLWIINVAFPKGINAQQSLELIKQNEVEKLRRTYSLGALLIFYIAPIFLLSQFNQQLTLLQNYLGENADLLSIYTFVFNVKPWHIARFVNIILTFFVCFYADYRLRHVGSGPAVSETGGGRFLSWVLLFRGVCGMYTLFCSLYILCTTVDIRLSFVWRFLPF
ncbi:MAG: hypothetical protein WBF13_05760 [Candidatus Zixiibacteriota bacterium]